MLDTKSVTYSGTSTEVVPSDRIFSELGKNTYDYKDLLSELIDNAIAARVPEQRLCVSICLLTDTKGTPVAFVIRDNASGIDVGKLGSAITPAGLQSVDSLNEHGLGMKQAVAALGNLKYLATRTKGEAKTRVIEQFRFGSIPTGTVDYIDTESGTEIVVQDLSPVVTANPMVISRNIVPYLGARYRRFLRPENRKLELTISFRREGADKTDYSWIVEEVKPLYFHPSTRLNQPAIKLLELAGDGWAAELTFGYAPQEESEYDELGLEPPGKFHPYHVSLGKQGLDVILHDRVILFHQLSELGIIAARHADYNNVRGEIVLKHGFFTAITKNSVIADQHFLECVDRVRRILNGEIAIDGKRQNYLKGKSYPEQIPERLLRDRLAIWPQNNPLNKRANVKTEFVVQGIEGYIDILADGEAWEIKPDQASAIDVYQLFMYMDVGGFKKGYLVASGLSTGATTAVEHIRKAHGLDIVPTTLDQFPITQPPSDGERSEYY